MGGGQILHHVRPGNSRRARRGRRVAHAADEARDARAHHRADRGDITMLDRAQRGGLGAAVGRVEQHDVGGVGCSQEAVVELIHLCKHIEIRLALLDPARSTQTDPSP